MFKKFGPALLTVLAVLASPVLAEGTITLVATPTGSQEVPGPGIPDGGGKVTLTIDPATNKLCYDIALKGIAAPTMAHIHAGAVGVAGPVVLGLPTPEGGSARGCLDAPKETIAKFVQSPDNYYFNVHNAVYKAGALRGQLALQQN